MMKSLFLFLLLTIGIFAELKAQDDEEYYKPPTKRLDVRNNTYPNLNSKAVSLYVGIEGGFKLNSASLDNSLNGLISIQNNNVFSWGVSLGYNYDNRWAVETGYLKSPIYLIQSVASRRGFTTYQIGKDFTTIPLRYKYKVWTLDAITKTAGLYIGGGVLFNTNVKERLIKEVTFTGYDYRFSAAGRDSVKLELTSKSFLTKKLSAVLELQTELQGRVANGFYISLFGRMAFAPNAGIRSDLLYTEDANKIGTATHALKGISYNFGLLLRFDLARGYKYQSQVE